MQTLPKIRLFHIVIDGFFVFFGFLLAYFLRVGFIFSSDVPFGPYTLYSGLASLIWVIVLFGAKYYAMEQKKRFERAIFRAVGGISALGGLVFLHFFLQKAVFSRLMLVFAFILGFLALTCTHKAFEWHLFQQKKQKKAQKKLMLIGMHPAAATFVRQSTADPYSNFNFVGGISPYGVYKSITGVKYLGKMNALEENIQKTKPQGLLLAHAHEHILSVKAIAAENNLQFYTLPQIQQLPHKKLLTHNHGGQKVFEIQ